MAVMDVTINATRILHSIWMNPGISRIDLSKELNLNKSTITKIVSGLLDEGLILLADQPDETDAKGRKPTGLFLNPQLGVILGIEIQTDSWIAVATTPDGTLVDHFVSEQLPPDSSLVPLLEHALEAAVERQNSFGRRVIGAGIGLSGQVDPYHGILLSSNPLNVHQSINICKLAKTRYSFPVIVENDANCCCWNVIMDERIARERNFLCVLAETRRTGWGTLREITEGKGVAIGLGVVIKNSVLHGDQFSAGEFQSVFKRNNNPTQFHLEMDELKGIDSDPQVRLKIYQELSRNIALLVNTLNMTMVKVFGTFVKDPQVLRPMIEEEIRENWLYDSPVQCRVEVAPENPEAVALGAAAYFLHRSFTFLNIWDEDASSYPQGIELLRTGLKQDF